MREIMRVLRTMDCKFILQKFDNKSFAENFMLTVGVPNADDFRNEVIEKKLPEKFGIRIGGKVSDMPYGREVNIIDIAGVRWRLCSNRKLLSNYLSVFTHLLH